MIVDPCKEEEPGAAISKSRSSKLSGWVDVKANTKVNVLKFRAS